MAHAVGWLVAFLGLLVAAYLGLKAYTSVVANPRVIAELREQPNGERAARVTAMYFDDGTCIPVNYLREGNTVYVGADGRWWRRFRPPGSDVTLLLRGQMLHGHGVAVLDDPAYTRRVFDRLRPTVPKWLPSVLDATLVEISLSGHSQRPEARGGASDASGSIN